VGIPVKRHRMGHHTKRRKLYAKEIGSGSGWGSSARAIASSEAAEKIASPVSLPSRGVRSLPAQGVTGILISHNLHHVFQSCDRVVAIARGEIVFDKPVVQTNLDEVSDAL
jgi:hypothetical protein